MASKRQTETTAPAETTATAEAKAAGTRTGTKGVSAKPATAGQLMDGRTIEYSCLTNAAYHAARRGWLDMAHRLTMFVVLIFGSATMAVLLSQWPQAAAALAVVPVVASAGDLVAGFSSRARDHEFLARRYWRLLADLRTGANDRDLNREIYGIYADEPPQHRALFALAENQAMDQLGVKASHHNKVPAWHRALKNLRTFPAKRFAPDGS